MNTTVFNRYKHRGRVYLTERQGAEFLGIHLATLQKHRKEGVGPKVFRKSGFQKSQPKKVMYVYRVPDLIVWYQSYMVFPVIRKLRTQINFLESGCVNSIAKYYISDQEFFADGE